MRVLVDATVVPRANDARDLRRALTIALSGDVPAAYVEDAVLVVHELVTAAVFNGRGPFHVRVERLPSYVRAAVTDRGGRLPQRLRPPDDPSGDVALRIVETLADSWGTAHMPCESMLWAKVLLAGA